MSKDARIDAYVSKSADFARPILDHLRRLVHKACPEVQETMKWSFPHFDYKGQMMCSMAAFKQHAVFGFWKSGLMKDPKKILEKVGDGTAMGNFGRMTSLKDVPPVSVLVSYIKEAMKLNDEGVRVKRTPKPAKAPPKASPLFIAALKRNTKASKNFDAFPPGQKREYIDWIAEAKQETTKESRIKQAIEWISQGKYRNWKYMTRQK